MSALPTISIIVVSHNATVYLVQTLESVRAERERVKALAHIQVIVVDANSTDGAPRAVEKGFPEVELFTVHQPVGFSAANNFGATHAKGDILFFLNPDTELLPGSLEALLRFFQKNQDHRIGAVSGLLFYSDGSIQPQGGRLPNLWNVFGWMCFLDDIPLLKRFFHAYQERDTEYFLQSRQTGWVGGTAFAIRSEVFLKVGGWDDSIFLYGEDVEFCQRLHQYGYAQCLEPNIRIIHHQHKSTGGSSSSLVGEMRGLIHIWKRHHSAWQLPVIKSLLFVGSCLRFLLFGILKHDENRRKAYVKALRAIVMA